MYKYLFAFYYYYFSHLKNESPRVATITGLTVIQFIHLACVIFGPAKLFGVDRELAGLIWGSNLTVVTLLTCLLLWVLNFLFFNRNQVERILETYESKKVFTLKNGILVFVFGLIVPITICYFLSPKIS